MAAKVTLHSSKALVTINLLLLLLLLIYYYLLSSFLKSAIKKETMLYIQLLLQ